MADNGQDKLHMAQEFDAPLVVEPTPEAPKAPQKFVREIDLKDGSGPQKFEGDTWEQLVDKLAVAQENATRKIQQLSRERKSYLEPEKQSSDYHELKPTKLNVEDVIALQANPHELFRRIYQAETGLTPDEFRMRENDRRRYEAQMAAERDFVNKHTREYNPTPENAERLTRFLQEQNLPVSRRNLEYAFQELRADLSAKAVPVEAKAEVTPAPAQTRAPNQVSLPPSSIRPSFGGRGTEETSGGIDAAEVARIAQSSSPAE